MYVHALLAAAYVLYIYIDRRNEIVIYGIGCVSPGPCVCVSVYVRVRACVRACVQEDFKLLQKIYFQGHVLEEW